MNSYLRTALLFTVLTCAAGAGAFAAEIPGTTLDALSDVQKYERAIHIMAKGPHRAGEKGYSIC